MYALQLTHLFTGNYFVHEVHKALQSKGALGEHYIQTKYDEEVMFQSKSNRNNINSIAIFPPASFVA